MDKIKKRSETRNKKCKKANISIDKENKTL